jgi:F-type H+-transporting ATPase subunit delta
VARRDLAHIGELVRAVPELVGFLAHPLVPAEDKKALCRKHFGPMIQPEQLTLLDLLVDKKRAGLLPDVVECFGGLVDDHQGVIKAEVWAAVPLTSQEETRLRAALAAAFHADPVVTVAVHPELIGGLRVRVKDTVIDGSIRTALKMLSEHLKATCSVPPATGDRSAD